MEDGEIVFLIKLQSRNGHSSCYLYVNEFYAYTTDKFVYLSPLSGMESCFSAGEYSSPERANEVVEELISEFKIAKCLGGFRQFTMPEE